MAKEFDDFLLWLSEEAAGTWDAFKDAHSWIFGRSADHALRKPSWTAHLLGTLGHLEMSWERQRWSVTRPCL